MNHLYAELDALIRQNAELIVALTAMVSRCPGGAEYGHGFSRTDVHGDCCAHARALLAKAKVPA